MFSLMLNPRKGMEYDGKLHRTPIHGDGGAMGLLQWLRAAIGIVLETTLGRIMAVFWSVVTGWDALASFVSQITPWTLMRLADVFGAKAVIPGWLVAFGFVVIIVASLTDHIIRREKAGTATDPSLSSRLKIAQDGLASVLTRVDALEAGEKRADDKVMALEGVSSGHSGELDRHARSLLFVFEALQEAAHDERHISTADGLIDDLNRELGQDQKGRVANDEALKSLKKRALLLARDAGDHARPHDDIIGMSYAARIQQQTMSVREAHLTYWRDYAVEMKSRLLRSVAKRLVEKGVLTRAPD